MLCSTSFAALIERNCSKTREVSFVYGAFIIFHWEMWPLIYFLSCHIFLSPVVFLNNNISMFSAKHWVNLVFPICCICETYYFTCWNTRLRRANGIVNRNQKETNKTLLTFNFSKQSILQSLLSVKLLHRKISNCICPYIT